MEERLIDAADLSLPRGFRDILPTEARELHAIRDALLRVFGSYAYVPLEPPSVERASAALSVEERRLIRFLDQGSLLALRPDVTSAIARVVAQRYRGAEGPLRLSYFASVFRQDRAMRGSEREYDQAGVELIGAEGVVADAEVLAVLAEALAAAGLRSFRVGVGHMAAVRENFAGLRPGTLDAVIDRLRAADHVEAFRLASSELPADRVERARRAMAARGGTVDEIDLPAAVELRTAIALARELYPTASFVPDLSVMPALPYYTGIVFEVVSAHAGAPIATGGRYDGLLARYGADRAATGFAIAVPLLHQALVADGWALAKDGPIVALEGGDDRARLQLAGRLRRAGVTVALGGVADSAGRAVIAVEAIDASTVRYEGRPIATDELASLVSR